MERKFVCSWRFSISFYSIPHLMDSLLWKFKKNWKKKKRRKNVWAFYFWHKNGIFSIWSARTLLLQQEHCFERLSFKTLRKRYNTKQDKHNSSFVLQIEKRKEYRSFLIRLLFNLFRFWIRCRNNWNFKNKLAFLCFYLFTFSFHLKKYFSSN